MIARAGDAIAQSFNDLRSLDATAVRNLRRQKFLDIGRKLGWRFKRPISACVHGAIATSWPLGQELLAAGRFSLVF
jgi:hypothetical protein